jgi:hypothetical protein
LRSLFRHAIKVWCLNVLVPVATQRPGAVVVGQDKNDVGFFVFTYRVRSEDERSEKQPELDNVFHGPIIPKMKLSGKSRSGGIVDWCCGTVLRVANR